MPETEVASTTTETEEKPVVTETETTEDETTETESSEGEDEETKEAVRLYQALKGPGAEKIIRVLAQDIGILNTKADKKEATDLILESLEESLGDQYKFLAPKLKPALDKILDAQMRKVDDRFSELSRRELVKASDEAVTDLMKNADFEKHYPRILQLTKEILPADNTPPKAFLQKLYKLAKAEAAEKSTSENKGAKLKKAIDDVPNRIRDSSVGGDDKNLKNDHPVSRREAVRLALQEIEEGAKK